MTSSEAFKRCVVQLALYDRDRHEIFGSGSGAIVSDTGHILTAAHVVMDYETKSILYGRNNCSVLVATFVADDQPTRFQYSARIVSTSSSLQKMVAIISLLDIAVLQIDGNTKTNPPLFSGIRSYGNDFIVKEEAVAAAGLPYLPFSMSPTNISTGDSVQLYGYPVGPNFNTTDIRLTIAKTVVSSKTDAANAYVRIDATNVAATACSGGPLLNDRGCIVAIMSKDFVQGFLKGKGGVNLSHCRLLSMLEPGHNMPRSDPFAIKLIDPSHSNTAIIAQHSEDEGQGRQDRGGLRAAENRFLLPQPAKVRQRGTNESARMSPSSSAGSPGHGRCGERCCSGRCRCCSRCRSFWGCQVFCFWWVCCPGCRCPQCDKRRDGGGHNKPEEV
jgi:hypothetical protein